jgi:hypothetical protein
MLRHEGTMLMYVRRGSSWLFVLLIMRLSSAARAQLIDGLDSYADAVVGLSTTKWTGPRVPAPIPQPRPASQQRLDSGALPLSVHAGSSIDGARLAATLAAAEDAFVLLFDNGFISSFGDGAGARDLYLVDRDVTALVGSDATGNFSALDGTRAFALIDARLPTAQLRACVAQALMDAQLLELDPAEHASLRRSVAAYFAWLIGGELCEDERAAPEQNPFAQPGSAAAWMQRLSARQDQNRGTFLFDMWQLARQRTWEGADLRASPDLFEAIAKVLSLAHEDFNLVAGELAEGQPARTLSFASLPAFPEPKAAPLEVLGSTRVRVDLGQPRPGTRLRAWSRADAGRYTLSALRLDALGAPLSRLELPPRTTGQLSIELDARTFAIAITLTRVADVGLPDPDAWDDGARAAGLIVDAAP